MTAITLTADELGPLVEALPGGLGAFGAHYLADVDPTTDAQLASGTIVFSDGPDAEVPAGAAETVSAALASARAAMLPALRARLKSQVDDRAEALRLTLITPGSGQAMEYQEAYAEAVQVDQAVKAGQTIDAAAFPMLSASLGYDLDPTTGKATVDIPGEARAVLAAYDAYQKAGAAIRGVRLAGKAAIDAAADVAAVQAAFAAIDWPKLV